MQYYDIIIPTYRSKKGIKKQLEQVKLTSNPVKLISTHINSSASVNRNYGLNQSVSEYIIMIDDDIKGFYNGWAEDLLKPFELFDNVSMVSARLMHNKTKTAVMMNIIPDLTVDYQILEDKHLPSAAIAFKNSSLRFDEFFKGGGFEDTLYCDELNLINPEGLYIVNNKCKLIHKNETKNQSQYFNFNKNYYFQRRNNLGTKQTDSGNSTN